MDVDGNAIERYGPPHPLHGLASVQHRDQLQAAPHEDAPEGRHHAPLVSCNALLCIAIS